MKCTIPEISWHNREPVLSVDINPVFEKYYRLASGGADCHVLIWQITICDSGSVRNEVLADLTRHQRAVNVVRWSPNGQYLASADDEANIIIWQLKTDNIPLLEGETNDRETWIVKKVMRGHKEDIYDLCWSNNGLKLLSGSIDNTAIIWDFNKFKFDNILQDHKGFVQGVSWDPKGHYIATISTDRICRIYDCNGKQVRARIQKGCLPVPSNHYLFNKEIKYFHDDTFKSFFRRLNFSPDGALLAVPSGRVEVDNDKNVLNATFIFAVENWSGPVAILPSLHHCSTVVKFCPILFELHEKGPEPTVSLPYRMILAIGTDHDVILYDTQQVAPFAYFRQIHYTRLTDLTWSNDGLLLIASSTDGFCALITFEPNELGVEYVKEESEAETNPINVSGCELLDESTNKIDEIVEKPKKPTLLETWTIKTPKKQRNTVRDDGLSSSNKKTIYTSSPLDNNTKFKNENQPVVKFNKITPKRITPIPVKDDKEIKSTPSKQNKINPLLNFLKSGSTEKTKTISPINSTTKQPSISGDSEARDAWKCENDTKQSSRDHASIISDDEADEFSLRLEDSNLSSEMYPSKNISSQINEPFENNKNVSAVQDEKFVNIVEKPKRRIPLTTLSSPKIKKK